MKPVLFQELKQQLVQDADLSQIWLFYMDHFADHPEFIELGEPVNHAFLEAVVPQICQQMFGGEISIDDLLLIYIAEYQFFHGPVQVEGRPGGVIYFEDAKIGLLAVSAEFPPTAEVKYSRFSEPFRLMEPNQYDYN